MPKIKQISAWQILDSRGNPTIEAKVITAKSSGSAMVPSGASTGRHEAWELRDQEKPFSGQGVLKAVKNIIFTISPYLKNIDCQNQAKIDQAMITLDGTENKRKLGANAILAVSLACAAAAANEQKVELYRYLRSLIKTKTKLTLPTPYFNVINGGKHADSPLSFQEFMIVPQFKRLSDNLRAASEIYHQLKQLVHQKYGRSAANVGDEGGFAPRNLQNNQEVLSLLVKAITKSGYEDKVKLAIDAAASQFYHQGVYRVDGKNLTRSQLLNYYLKLIKKFPLISLEDPFHEEDFAAFAQLNQLIKPRSVMVVADDLTVSNSHRLKTAIEQHSGNCLLLKVNQIGTLTEALEVAQLAFRNKWKVMVSHRSGETEDTFIADLAVALGCGLIKVGAPCRGERTAKYNRLLRIERELS